MQTDININHHFSKNFKKSCNLGLSSIIKVYVRKLFKLKNDGKKEYLCLLSICTANLNGINNMNHIQTLFKVFSIDNCLSM